MTFLKVFSFLFLFFLFLEFVFSKSGSSASRRATKVPNVPFLSEWAKNFCAGSGGSLCLGFVMLFESRYS